MPAGIVHEPVDPGRGTSRETQVQASGADVTFDTNDITTVPWSNGLHRPDGRTPGPAGQRRGDGTLYVFQSGAVAAYIGGIKVTPPDTSPVTKTEVPR